MIENATRIRLKGKNDKEYFFICDADAPIGEAHDILCQMKAIVVNRMMEVQKAEEKSSSEDEE